MMMQKKTLRLKKHPQLLDIVRETWRKEKLISRLCAQCYLTGKCWNLEISCFVDALPLCFHFPAGGARMSRLELPPPVPPFFLP